METLDADGMGSNLDIDGILLCCPYSVDNVTTWCHLSYTGFRFIVILTSNGQLGPGLSYFALSLMMKECSRWVRLATDTMGLNQLQMAPLVPDTSLLCFP